MKQITNTLIVLAILMTCLSVLGQEKLSPALTYPIGHYETIYSHILNEKRTIIVHLPDDYETQSKSYPLLFVLDAEDTLRFIQIISANMFYSGIRRLPKMIVVGILNTNRTRDMTPRKVAQRNGSGGGELFLEFISSELQPYIKSKYRSGPYRILFGGSSAGMLTLYALFNRPETFDAYIASRPTLNSLINYTWDSDTIFKSAIKLFTERSSLKKFLYIDCGGQEDALHEPTPIHHLISIFKSKAPQDFSWEMRVISESGYRSAESLKDGLMAVFNGWHYSADSLFTNGFEGIEIHAKILSERFGYPVTVADLLGEMDFLIFGSRFLENDNRREAIVLFEFAISVYSNSWLLYDSLAEAYMKNDQQNLAIRSYAKSLELNPMNSNAIKMLKKLNNKK